MKATLPTGTMLFANTWVIPETKEEHDKPEDFIPERFWNNKFGIGNLIADDDGRRATYGFGAGRRVCPGQKLAENSLVRFNFYSKE